MEFIWLKSRCMPSKEEQERRNKLLQSLREKADAEFEQGLPMGRYLFGELFDHLDLELGKQGCDHTLRRTESFLRNVQVDNIAAVKNWLSEHGGYCDCEVLGDVEELFDKR